MAYRRIIIIDAHPDGDPAQQGDVVVISERFRSSRLGGAEDVVGQVPDAQVEINAARVVSGVFRGRVFATSSG